MLFIPKEKNINPIPMLRVALRIVVTHVYCGTIHNSQVMETAKMPHH
jgi:hypothetical protein